MDFANLHVHLSPLAWRLRTGFQSRTFQHQGAYSHRDDGLYFSADHVDTQFFGRDARVFKPRSPR